MKKIYLLWVAMFGALAFSAVAVSAAMAEGPEWLVNGAAIAVGVEEAVETTAELTLIFLAGAFFEPEGSIKCSVIFDGVVLANGQDLVTSLLTLTGATATEADPVRCLGVKTCETGSSVSAENLPWATSLVLMEAPAPEYLDLFFEDGSGLPAYLIDCLALGGEQIFLCQGETSADMSNNGGKVLGVFLKEELIAEKLEATCFAKGNPAEEKKSVMVQEGEGETSLENGRKLEVSTSSSPSEGPEWLVNGVAAAGQAVETAGAALLIHLAGGFFEPEAVVECSGIFDGLVLAGGKDTVEKVLNEAGEEDTESKPIICKGVKTCENGSTVSAENLPWATQLSLMATGPEYLDLFFEGGKGLPAYLIDCLFAGEHIFLCQGETSVDMTNQAGGVVLGEFLPAELIAEKLEGTCFTTTNEEKKEITIQEGDGDTALAAGGTLEISGG